MADIITGTPASLTYEHELVRQVWTIVWAIASGALVVIIGWIGLSFIVAEHLGRPQAGWREMVPRLALGWWPRRHRCGGARWLSTSPTR